MATIIYFEIKMFTFTITLLEVGNELPQSVGVEPMCPLFYLHGVGTTR